tara:strand:- start:318 stop:887 length:570 start_codon:yes stop_codon:yes gene_type:complete
MSEHKFLNEQRSVFTWDIDNPKECYNIENCGKYTKLEDYMQDVDFLVKEYSTMKENSLMHNFKNVLVYEQIHYPEDLSDYDRKLLSEIGYFDDSNGMPSDMVSEIAIRGVSEMLYKYKIRKDRLVKQRYDYVTSEQLAVLKDYLNERFKKIKSIENEKNPIEYILNELLPVGYNDLPLLREYYDNKHKV